MILFNYHFDIKQVGKGASYNIEKKRGEFTTKEKTLQFLKGSDNLNSLHFLGGGTDIVSIIDSNSLFAFVIEPANGLKVSIDFINSITSYEKLKKKGFYLNKDYKTLLGLDELIYRIKRNDEYIFKFRIEDKKNDLNSMKIFLSYENSNIEHEYDYQEFIKALLLFSEQVFDLYIALIPEISEFKTFNEIKFICKGGNFLREKFSPSSSAPNEDPFIADSFYDYILSQ